MNGGQRVVDWRAFVISLLMGAVIVYESHCVPVHILDFYSQSFVPLGLQVSYRVEGEIGIYYNASILTPFPGKLIFNMFVRKLASAPGEPSKNIMKIKNVDFCKSIEMLRNLSLESTADDPSPLQPTFINSCPLTEGFYYVTNVTLKDDLVPLYVTNGIYWLHFELMQILDEVNRLVNIKAKCSYVSPW